MPSRRHLLGQALAGVAGLAAAALPGRALAQARANPMPDSLRQALERDPTAPVLGNPQGDITLTEFFDYNCAFCRKMVPTMQRLIGADPQLRVVFREWPVFGEGSDFAARAALASLEQGKYWPFHAALMGLRGKVDAASTLRVAREVGLDEARLTRDMEAARVEDHISSSFALGEHMGLMGTPSFIAGDEALFGQQSFADMQALIARARATLAG